MRWFISFIKFWIATIDIPLLNLNFEFLNRKFIFNTFTSLL